MPKINSQFLILIIFFFGISGLISYSPCAKAFPFSKNQTGFFSPQYKNSLEVLPKAFLNYLFKKKKKPSSSDVQKPPRKISSEEEVSEEESKGGTTSAYSCSEFSEDEFSVGYIKLGYGCDSSEDFCISFFHIERNRCHGDELIFYFCDPKQQSLFSTKKIKCEKGCEFSGLSAVCKS